MAFISARKTAGGGEWLDRRRPQVRTSTCDEGNLKKIMTLARQKFLILCAVAACVALLCPALASATPILGSAQDFAVLGHESVINGHSDPNPDTQVYGNLGVTPGTSITGFPPGVVTGGAIHNNDAVAVSALADATSAYGILAALPGTDLTGQDLGGGRTITPGVYTMTDSVAYLNGALTLDATGIPNASFVFNLAHALTTGTGAVVNVIGGDSGTEVYWVIGSSATLGTGTVFAGNILADASVTLDPTAEILCGRAFALTGSVTLIDNLISNNNTAEDFGSGRSDFGSYGFSGGAVPIPPTILLLGSGLAGLVAFRKRFKKA